MKWAGWVMLGLTGAVAGEHHAAWERIRPGTTMPEVRAMLGEPEHRSRQIIAHRCIEQWEYRQPHRGRVWFECRRGELPVVLRVVADDATAPDGKKGRPGTAPVEK